MSISIRKWFERFVEKHGDRMVFLTIVMVLGAIFFYIPDLKDIGKTLLTGGAMLVYNKIRSPEKEVRNG